MGDYKDKLKNKPEAFLRKTFEIRMQQYGFKNIERMEKFLWDLELFQQIQEKLGNRIVLKGGAAIQFYLPIEAQRTSVDIDMIFYGTKEEIDTVLEDIVNQLNEHNNIFSWKEHIPKNSRTTLPLFTYYVDVPSVLKAKELRSEEKDNITQEVKAEFIMQNEPVKYVLAKGNNIFAVKSDLEYQILSLDHLFADKLTTLGPNTIGVQDDRLDEQIKQFYDIWMLTNLYYKEIDVDEIRKEYLKRAIQECEARKGTFNVEEIKADVRKQMNRYKKADSGSDAQLKRAINDFKSLYLNAKVNFNPQKVACGAVFVEFMYETILDGIDLSIIRAVLETAKMLKFENLEGKERGLKIKEMKQILLEKAVSYSWIDIKELKGKRPIRIFWAIVNKDNVDEIRKNILSII